MPTQVSTEMRTSHACWLRRVQMIGTDVAEEDQDLTCPISLALYEQAVCTVDGLTYERREIENWLQLKNTSPRTGLVLANSILTANRSMASKVVWYCRRQQKLKKQQTIASLSLKMKIGRSTRACKRKLRATVLKNYLY